MRVAFSDTAREQVRDTQAAYRGVSRQTAERFAKEVRRVVRLLGRYPRAGHRTDGFRRLILSRFPYSILYEIWTDRVYILELVHQKQEPDYWGAEDDE